MVNVRLRPDQIERLRASGNAAAVIRHAVMRYKRGDFKPLRVSRKRGGVPLATLSLWHDPGVKPDQLRAILDAHFKTPDAVLRKQCAEEIAELDKQIADMMASCCVRPDRAYILAEDKEEDND